MCTEKGGRTIKARNLFERYQYLKPGLNIHYSSENLFASQAFLYTFFSQAKGKRTSLIFFLNIKWKWCSDEDNRKQSWNSGDLSMNKNEPD